MALAFLAMLGAATPDAVHIDPDKTQVRPSNDNLAKGRAAAAALQVFRDQQGADIMGWRRTRGRRRTFPGLGWSVAHDRRMAKKRRQVIKARRAKR